MNQTELSRIFTQTEQEQENSDLTSNEPEIQFNSADIEIANKNLVKELDNCDKLQDIDYSRRVLQNLLTKGQELVNIAMENASDGKARDIEVASGVINMVSDLSGKLIDLHNKIHPTQQNNPQSGTYIQNQNNVVMSTHELLNKILEEKHER